MRKILSSVILSFLLFFASSSVASAHCPLCTAGAGAGLALSRWLGIDDSISGIWIAAFLGATALWGAYALKKKYIPYQETVIYLAVFGLTIWSFYQFKLVNEHAGLIMGVPKLTFGIVSGGVVFYLVELTNKLVRKTRGKVLFPYQPIVFSLGSMLILSLAMFIFINYYI